jgi:hypothetical protein
MGWSAPPCHAACRPAAHVFTLLAQHAPPQQPLLCIAATALRPLRRRARWSAAARCRCGQRPHGARARTPRRSAAPAAARRCPPAPGGYLALAPGAGAGYDLRLDGELLGHSWPVPTGA